MVSNNQQVDLTHLFFKELKKYNSTNFKNLYKSDLGGEIEPEVYKAFSSVITRFFIFREKHPEIGDADMRILYYRLKIDMLARFFAEYPEVDAEQLQPFQTELKNYLKDTKEPVEDIEEIA